MVTPQNSVPLGQAGTGAAFILNQNQATAPLAMFANLNKNREAMQAAAAKQQAEENEKIRARQQKLLDTPSEFGFHFQAEGQRRVKEFQDEYVALASKNGGRLSQEDEYRMQRKQKDLVDYKAAAEGVAKAVGDITKTLLQDTEFDKAATTAVLRDLYTDPKTGNPRNPLEITQDLVNSTLNNNYRLFNKGKVLDNFVKGVHGGMVQKFSQNGRFDVETIIKHNLPIKLNQAGEIQYDKQGRPQLDMTQGLLVEADNNPKIRTMLDGLMAEEDAKEAADPSYVGKIRPAILKELIEGELYLDKKINQKRMPQPRAVAGPSKADAKKEADANERLKLINKVGNGDSEALQSLVNSAWDGGKVVDARVVTDNSLQAPNGALSTNNLSGLYNPGSSDLIELTIDRGYTNVGDPNDPLSAKKRERVLEKIIIDKSIPGWKSKMNAALNSGNRNVEPETFQRLLGEEESGTAKLDALDNDRAPAKPAPVNNQPKKKAKYDNL